MNGSAVHREGVRSEGVKSPATSIIAHIQHLRDFKHTFLGASPTEAALKPYVCTEQAIEGI